MKFFLDTASLDKILFWKNFDLVHGVTTNPTLLSKEISDPIKVIKKFVKLLMAMYLHKLQKKTLRE